MTNAIPAVLSSLTFNSVDLQVADLSLHLDIVSGLNDGLEVRGEDTVIPSATGRAPRNRVADMRYIQLAGWMRGVGATEAAALAAYQALRDTVETTFALTAIATLSGTALDGSTRSISARPTSIMWDESVLGDGQLAIALEAPGIDWTVTPPDPGP